MVMLSPRTRRDVSAGRFYPLGATLEPGGVNFAIYSKHATEVWLCLFAHAGDREPTDVIRLEQRTRFIFHAFVAGVTAGQLYGYRIRGPHDPANGHRFNENKLLVDPYARALTGKARDEDGLLYGYRTSDKQAIDPDLTFDDRDNAHAVPKSIVIDDNAFDWGDDRHPNIPFEELIIYEVHLKGFTASPSSGVAHPGTYSGFIEKIPHLLKLGVNAVELLPLHERHVTRTLSERGLTNYWGYDTLGFFAPESAYRQSSVPGAEVEEWKALVAALHRADIEVILDVVYNHTAEGDELGPTLCHRGVDNATYYALKNGAGPHEPRRRYENWSGCGNSLNLADAHVIRFVMDSLRYWVEVMHVDGFRFDLASILGRQDGRFQRASSFFDTVSQDPVLSRVKLIAEPWDLGAYEVGNFPVDWSEWNGKFRDCVRRFEKGDRGQLKELGYRLTGSSDLYGEDGRSAYNTINFITSHDGFTLADLVSYNAKHNDANLEDNRDGNNDNCSWNSGAEGPTTDPAIERLRIQRAKNLICQLLFSAGTPMLLGGDEVLRSQRGNNNAYCQDNELSWFDWSTLEVPRTRDFLRFVEHAIAFRRRYPAFMRRTFFSGRDDSLDDRPDIRWYGFELDDPAWWDDELRTLSFQLDGAEAEVKRRRGAGGSSWPPSSGATLTYLLFVSLNASWNEQRIQVPYPGANRIWRRVIDTSQPTGLDFREDHASNPKAVLQPQDHFVIAPRSTVVLIGR